MFVTMVRFKFHNEATMQSGRVSKVANKYLLGMVWHEYTYQPVNFDVFWKNKWLNWKIVVNLYLNWPPWSPEKTVEVLLMIWDIFLTIFFCFVWTVSSCQLLFQLVLHFSCRECFEHLKVWFEYEDYDSNWKTTIRIWRLRFKCEDYNSNMKTMIRIRRLRFELEDYNSNMKTTIQIWRLWFEYEDYDSNTKTMIRIRWLQFEYEDYDSNAKTTIWIWRLQSEYEDYNSNMNTKFRIWL